MFRLGSGAEVLSSILGEAKGTACDLKLCVDVDQLIPSGTRILGMK